MTTIHIMEWTATQIGDRHIRIERSHNNPVAYHIRAADATSDFLIPPVGTKVTEFDVPYNGLYLIEEVGLNTTQKTSLELRVVNSASKGTPLMEVLAEPIADLDPTPTPKKKRAVRKKQAE